MINLYTVSEAAKKLGVCTETIRRWDNEGKLKARRHSINNYRIYTEDDLKSVSSLIQSCENTTDYYKHIEPKKTYTSIELFAGAGGLALGLEKAGITHLLMNEIDK